MFSNLSNSIVKNRGLKIDQSKSSAIDSNLFLEVKPLSLMDIQTVYNSRIENKLFYFNIKNLLLVKRIIEKDALIISSKPNGNSTKGTEVKASEIGENLTKSNGNFYASVEGFLVYENGLYKIIPVIKNASFSIKVTANDMQVACNFFPPVKGYSNIAFDNISRELRKLKITAHPDISLVGKYLKILEGTDTPIFDVIIASGSKPEPGKNGWVEYLIETEKSNKPTVTGKGRVDFYNLSTIHSVSQNQKLAIIHPPLQGKAGIDVFGRITPADPVKKANSPQGSNTYFDSKSPNILLAKIGGYLTKQEGKLSISEAYNVRGNIDFHTGNIISKGAININGDVRSGFKLDLEKSIVVNGFVNDADLKSKDSITINGGFGGSGEGRISAAGNVSIRFVRNQTIYSGADILIAKEAVDANLFAKGSIKSLNGSAIIIGGSTIAEHDVEVKTLGNELWVKTKIQAGSNIGLLEKHKAISLEIEELKVKLQKTEVRIQRYSNIKNLTTIAKQQLTNIVTDYRKLENAMKELKSKQVNIQKILKTPSKSKIKVTGTVYPGVEIVIQNIIYKVTAIIRNKTFVVSETEEGVIDVI